jgi:hypothetical protein
MLGMSTYSQCFASVKVIKSTICDRIQLFARPKKFSRAQRQYTRVDVYALTMLLLELIFRNDLSQFP